MIGDAGFQAAERYPHVYDLGAEWAALTGLPFVYAVWAGRPDAATPEDVALLQDSLRAGLEHRAEIARGLGRRARRRGPSAAVCESYLTHNIRYQLGAEELSGAAAFIARAQAAGEIAPGRRASASSTTAAPSGRSPTPARHRRCRRPRSERDRRPRAGRPARDGQPARWTACWPTPPPGCACGFEDGVRLYHEASTLELGAAADARRQSLHGDGVVTYIIDRNVNYTNVCVTRCKFCNFYRPPGHKEGYTLDKDVLAHQAAGDGRSGRRADPAAGRA